MKISLSIPFIIFLIFFPLQSFTQWLEPEHLKTVVLIEVYDNNNNIGIGTGFLVTNNTAAKNTHTIVTCAHLIDSADKLFISFNLCEEYLNLDNKDDYKIESKIHPWVINGQKIRGEIILNDTNHILDKQLDLAIISFPPLRNLILQNEQIQIAVFARRFIPIDNFCESGAFLGDEVFFIGFPRGIGVGERLEPLIRTGIISWQSNFNDLTLLDAISLGGNSGSPVIIKDRHITKEGNKKCLVYGMVTGHFSDNYSNVYLESPTNQYKIEKKNIQINLGLVTVIRSTQIISLLNKFQE